MENFILPEKWCILRTIENHIIVNKWFANNNYGKPYRSEEYITIAEDLKNGRYYTTFRKLPEDYTEITFEQFERYIINKSEIIPKTPINENLDYLTNLLTKLEIK